MNLPILGGGHELVFPWVRFWTPQKKSIQLGLSAFWGGDYEGYLADPEDKLLGVENRHLLSTERLLELRPGCFVLCGEPGMGKTRALDAALKAHAQNVDDLHERAGSSRVIHLHGRLTQARSTRDPELVVDIGYRPIVLGELAPDGAPLRPHIVWFGEAVPAMDEALAEMPDADAVVVVGTSLQVYPAAGLAELAPARARRFLVDLRPGRVPPGYRAVAASAEIGLPSLTAELDLRTLQDLSPPKS